MTWTESFAAVYYGMLLTLGLGATLALASLTFGFAGLAVIKEGTPARERVAALFLAVVCVPASATTLWLSINFVLPHFLGAIR